MIWGRICGRGVVVTDIGVGGGFGEEGSGCGEDGRDWD